MVVKCILSLSNSALTMNAKRAVMHILFLMFLPFVVFAFDVSIKAKNLETLDVYNNKIKGDSIQIAVTLDSAKTAYNLYKYPEAIVLAGNTLELSKKFPNSDYAIESILILARAHRDIYLEHRDQSAFINTLKYYLKAITILESVESKLMLSKIYKEYGDFYFQLNLVDLTIKNYDKALILIKDYDDYGFQKEILEKLASLNYGLLNYEQAIYYYGELLAIHRRLHEKDDQINTLITLSQLYREAGNYDRAISTAKTIYEYYIEVSDQKGQVNYLSKIGEISYESGNNDQADKSFKQYFNLVKSDSILLKEEVASLRYVVNLITEGDIYAWSTDNGFWSDYETSIRFYNDAQKHTDFKLHPDLACKILNRAGSIFFKKEDYKTCITYFNLALYYAERTSSYKNISENHIMLARAFDAIEKWKDASDHYELHSAYKDSLMQLAAHQRQQVAKQLIDTEKERLKVEQTLDVIETQEIQELSMAEKELRNAALENELELYRQDVALKEMLIQNQKMAEDSAVRNLLLATGQLENVQNAKKIEQLNSDRITQNLRLKNQTADQENKRQQIKILEQENTLARTQQAYYVLSIFLISLILIFIMIVYLQKRKANKKLKKQNVQIESQSEKIKQAYKNLELLSTIGRDITSSLIIEEIIETVYENLNSLMDASVLGIGVYKAHENILHFPGVRERNRRLNDINIDLSDNNTLGAYCFNNQKEINIGNFFESYPDYIQPEVIPESGDGNATSIIYIPLTIGKKKLGVLTVQSFDTNAFDDYHNTIIRNIGIYTKIALENANVYRELELQSESLKKANTNIGEQNKLIEEQNKQLVNINEEKNNLMRILAHDLRNPLATAMSMTELVRYEKKNLSAEQYHASEIIWRGLNRMNDMIRKILDIKAAESQKVNLDLEIINCNELVNPMQKLFAASAESKGISLQIGSNGSEPMIKADRPYLLQIMENLISNALKFSSAHSSVFVNVIDREDVVRISVKDEGPGIPQKEMRDLFKKYHKLSPKPTGGEQSIGLGLSIVKKYVEVMNGKVWCESSVGKGSEFIVEFKKEQVPVA